MNLTGVRTAPVFSRYVTERLVAMLEALGATIETLNREKLENMVEYNIMYLLLITNNLNIIQS